MTAFMSNGKPKKFRDLNSDEHGKKCCACNREAIHALEDRVPSLPRIDYYCTEHARELINDRSTEVQSAALLHDPEYKP